MQAYLQMQNLWGVTIEDETKPLDLGPRPGATDTAPPIQPTVAEIAEQTKLQRNWTRDNEAAIGAISLKIRKDLWTLRKDTAVETWKLMKDTYGAETQAQKFQWIKELFQFRVPRNESPHKEFGRWDVLVNKLTKADMTLPDEVLLSILMENIPTVYKAVESLLLAAVKDDGLTSKLIKELYIAEWERKHPGHQRQ
jgi:hypothetical protein